jgi:hypothetical protein
MFEMIDVRQLGNQDISFPLHWLVAMDIRIWSIANFYNTSSVARCQKQTAFE